MIKVSAVIKAVVAGELQPHIIVSYQDLYLPYLYTCPADGRKDLVLTVIDTIL